MQIAAIAQENPGAMSPAASNGWANFTAYGPAAARVAVPLATHQNWSEVRALTLLASDPAHDSDGLSRIADAWLEPKSDELLTSLGGSYVPTVFDEIYAANPNPPGVWSAVTSQGIDYVIDQGPDNVLGSAFGYADVPLEGYQWGGGQLATSVFESGSRLSTLAQEANDSEPNPAPLEAGWEKSDFTASAAIFGAGAAGVIGAGLAQAVGLGGLLSVGVGAAAAAGGLWFLTGKLADEIYNDAFGKILDLPGQLIGGLLNLIVPGKTFEAAKAEGAPATQLPYRLTSNEPAILDPVSDGVIEIFSE